MRNPRKRVDVVEVGSVIGVLTVKSIYAGDRGGMHCVCECVCGTYRDVLRSVLAGGYVKSCGCATQELISKGSRKHGQAVAMTPAYAAWRHMKARCTNPDHPQYSHYGGRGISVYDPWLTDFELFHSYIGDSPGDGYSLGRIDNDAGYIPGNIRWETWDQQSNNKRTSVRATIDGETLTLKQWGDRLGMSKGTLTSRVLKGYTPEEAVRLGKNYVKRKNGEIARSRARKALLAGGT